MIRGLIFDFDGLICDTEETGYQAWRETYESLGCALPMAVWVTGIGGASGTVDHCAILESQLGHPVDRDAVIAQRRAREAQLTATLPVRPGIAPYIAAARARGLRLAVASSSSRRWVGGHLARLGLLEAFDVVKCVDDVTRAKPHPDLYQAALAALELAPDEAIAFEDSPNGIAAAKAAGLFCVAVPNPITGQLALDAADVRVESLAALPLATLLAQIAATGREDV